MYLYGETIKKSNTSRVIVLLTIAITWRITSKADFRDYTGMVEYIEPVISFFIGAILIGEFTRKIVRLFSKNNSAEQLDTEAEEQREDTAALNFAIMWALLYWVLIFIVSL